MAKSLIKLTSTGRRDPPAKGIAGLVPKELRRSLRPGVFIRDGECRPGNFHVNGSRMKKSYRCKEPRFRRTTRSTFGSIKLEPDIVISPLDCVLGFALV